MKKTIVITGASTGIGKATATKLALLGHQIILINRDSEKSRLALEEIKRISNNSNVYMVFADLSDKEQINKATDLILKKERIIDVLINNAGVYKPKLEFSKDGLELNLAVNYLATVRITNNLLPLIKQSKQGRIVNVSSAIHKKGNLKNNIFTTPKKYNGNQRYADTKLAVVLYTLKMTEILKGYNITVNTLHPGVISTDVFRDYGKKVQNFADKVLPSPDKGSEPSIKLAIDKSLDKTTGEYFNKTKIEKIKPKFINNPKITTLWEETQRYL